MLPNELIECNADDLRMRLQGSIINYRNMPCYVNNYRVGKPHQLQITKHNLVKDWIPTNDPDISCDQLGERLGLMNTNVGLYYYTRTPKRQFVQGLNTANTAVFQIIQRLEKNGNSVYKATPLTTGATNFYPHIQGIRAGRADILQQTGLPRGALVYLEVNLMQQTLMLALAHPKTSEMWNNQYPDPHSKDGNKVGSVAVSKRFFIRNNDNGNRELWDVYNIANIQCIGDIVDKRVRYRPNKAYLSQCVERNIGLMPV